MRARCIATDWLTAGLIAREAGIAGYALDITLELHRVQDDTAAVGLR